MVGKSHIALILKVLLLVVFSRMANAQPIQGFPLPDLETISTSNADKVTSLVFFEGFSTWALFAAFSPDDELVAATAPYEGARLWDVQTGTALASLNCPKDDHDGWTGGVSFTSDGLLVALACGSGVYLWDIATVLQETDAQPIKVLRASGTLLGEVVIDSTGKYLAASFIGSTHGDDPGMVWLWDIASGVELTTYSGNKACCPNLDSGGQLFAYSDNAITHVVNIETLEEVPTLSYRAEVFNSDWTLGADINIERYSGSSSARVIRLWEPQSASPPVILRNRDNHPPSVLSFSPEGTLLASGSSDGYNILLWDTVSHQRLAVLPTAGVSSLTFSHNGKFIMTTHMSSSGRRNNVQLWGVPVSG